MTPEKYPAWADDDAGNTHSWESAIGCCGSCISDEEYGYPTIDACCCLHRAEYAELAKEEA